MRELIIKREEMAEFKIAHFINKVFLGKVKTFNLTIYAAYAFVKLCFFIFFSIGMFLIIYTWLLYNKEISTTNLIKALVVSALSGYLSQYVAAYIMYYISSKVENENQPISPIYG